MKINKVRLSPNNKIARVLWCLFVNKCDYRSRKNMIARVLINLATWNKLHWNSSLHKNNSIRQNSILVDNYWVRWSTWLIYIWAPYLVYWHHARYIAGLGTDVLRIQISSKMYDAASAPKSYGTLALTYFPEMTIWVTLSKRSITYYSSRFRSRRALCTPEWHIDHVCVYICRCHLNSFWGQSDCCMF